MKTYPAPSGLSEAAAARWNAVAPVLAERGEFNADLLKTYCQVWDRWRTAEDGLAQTGQLVRKAKGGVGPNPLIAISKQASGQARVLERQLGIDREHEDGSLMSLRQYGHRIGVSVESVSNAVSTGRLVKSVTRVGKAPKINDPELADREWAENTDLTKAPDYIKARAAALGMTVPVSPTEDSRVTLAEAAARERSARASLVELEYQSRAGDLVSAKAVEAAWLDIILQIRTVMLGVASKVKQRHQDAPRDVLATVDEEIRRGLETIAANSDNGAAA